MQSYTYSKGTGIEIQAIDNTNVFLSVRTVFRKKNELTFVSHDYV